MNRAQRFVLWITLGVIALALAFPPLVGMEIRPFIADVSGNSVINVGRLAVEAGLAGMVGSLFFLATGKRAN